jgi:NTF2 fold immunity protein
MRITIIFLLLLATLTAAVNAQKEHTDYVPDQKTAARVAQAILSAKFGEERVNALLPLLVDGSNKDYWIVQGNSHEAVVPSKGGGPAVWINKHSGCILSVTEHMK